MFLFLNTKSVGRYASLVSLETSFPDSHEIEGCQHAAPHCDYRQGSDLKGGTRRECGRKHSTTLSRSAKCSFL